jgi:DNA-binding NarL/FixJ family response regulator
MDTPKLRIAIADDHALFRQGLKSLLALRDDMVIVGETDKVDGLAPMLAAAPCDVLLLDLQMDRTSLIEIVARGEVWMPPALQARLASDLREPAPDPLTPREREIVRNVALGLRNAEVARKLFISEDTVKTHLNNVFQKIGVRDRVQLTLYAIRLGMIGVHDRPG